MNKRSFFLALAFIALPLSVLFAEMPNWSNGTRFMKAVMEYSEDCKFDTLHNWTQTEAEAEYDRLCERVIKPLFNKYNISPDSFTVIYFENPGCTYSGEIVYNDTVYEAGINFFSDNIYTKRKSYAECIDSLKRDDTETYVNWGTELLFKASANWDIPTLEKIACCSGRGDGLEYSVQRVIYNDSLISAYQVYSMEYSYFWKLCYENTSE